MAHSQGYWQEASVSCHVGPFIGKLASQKQVLEERERQSNQEGSHSMFLRHILSDHFALFIRNKSLSSAIFKPPSPEGRSIKEIVNIVFLNRHNHHKNQTAKSVRGS